MTYFVNRKVSQTYLVAYRFLNLISKSIIIIHSIEDICIDHVKSITIRFRLDYLFGNIPDDSYGRCNSTRISVRSPCKHVFRDMLIAPCIISCWKEFDINQITIVILLTFKLTNFSQFNRKTKSANHSSPLISFTIPFAHSMSIKCYNTVDEICCKFFHFIKIIHFFPRRMWIRFIEFFTFDISRCLGLCFHLWNTINILKKFIIFRII